MTSVADALRQHAPEYLQRFGQRMPRGHHKVLAAITRCRTGQLGGVHYQCGGCGREHWVGRSCGNRHCPNCGHEKSQLWLGKQSDRLLPVQHFMVTFTVPEALRKVLRGAQRQGYKALFDAAAESIRDVGSATRALRGCQLGYFGVLHTWGRDPMVYHPHVHFVVPGGGVKVDEQGHAVSWQATAENFLFHHGTLVEVYKAKLADHLRACELYDHVPADTWRGKFVVDIKPVGDGGAVLKYLAPYVNRVAISDKRIVAVDEQTVTYRYTPSGESRSKVRTVSGTEFVRGFVQHTLPRRFQKVRYYGWMRNGKRRIQRDEVKWLVYVFLGWMYWLATAHAPQVTAKPPSTVRCAECGEAMHVVEVTYQPVRTLSEHALAYLDSG
jgi:hypothetical protein